MPITTTNATASKVDGESHPRYIAQPSSTAAFIATAGTFWAAHPSQATSSVSVARIRGIPTCSRSRSGVASTLRLRSRQSSAKVRCVNLLSNRRARAWLTTLVVTNPTNPAMSRLREGRA